MTDVFAKALADLKPIDFAGELPPPSRVKQPSSLDLLREAGVAGQTRPRTPRAVDIVGEMIRAEKAKKADPAAALAAIPKWADAVASIQGYDQLGYDQQKKLYDEYVAKAVAELQKVDTKTDPLMLEQQVRNASPAPVDPTGGKSTLGRAVSSSISNTKAAATGALGYVLAKFGNDDAANQLFASMAEYTKQASDMGKANDTLTEALKPEGSLTDWAVFNVGQIIPSLVESAIFATAGAVIGGASSGGLASIPGAAAGIVGKSLLKKEFVKAAAKAAARSVATKEAAGMTRAAALEAAKAELRETLQKQVGRSVGSVAAMLTASGVRGVGEVAQNAQAEGIDPKTLSALKVASGAGAYALLETFSDKLLLDTVTKGVGGGVIKRTLKRGGATALTEGATEVGQDTATALAAGTPQPTALDRINAFAAGAVGGGVVGGGAAALRGRDTTSPVAPPPAGEETDEDLAGTPADASTVAPGTTMEIEGATLVVNEAGRWEYAPGAVPNETADTILSAQPAPAPTVDDVQYVTRVGPVEDDFDDEQLPPEAELTPAEELEGELSDLLWSIQNNQPGAERAVRSRLSELTDTELQAADAIAPQGSVAELVRRFNQQDRLFTTATPAPAPAPAQSAIETQLAPLRTQLTDSSYLPFAALQEANRLILRLTPEQRRAEIAANPNGALARFTDDLGMQNTVATAPQSTWARAVTVAINEPGGNVLQSLAVSTDAGRLNNRVAELVAEAYQAAGVPLPTVTWEENPPPIRQPDGSVSTDYAGAYQEATHRVFLNPRTTANTVVHEMMHGLTVRGLERLQRLANQGDANAQDVLQLIRELHRMLVNAAGERRVYGNASIQEMFAEMVRPEFIALAARTPIPGSELSESAMRGSQIVLDSNNADGTILDVISRLVTYILRKITGNRYPEVDQLSVLSWLRQTAAYTAAQTGRPADAPAPERVTRAVRVTPGQALPVGTRVEETPRDHALLPTRDHINSLQAVSPATPIMGVPLLRWFFQPGTILRGGTGQPDFVVITANGNTYIVQPLDEDGRISGPAAYTARPVTAGQVLRSIPHDAQVASSAPRTGGNTPAEPIATPVRVTRGQPLPIGATVEETPRDRALLPASDNMSAMRSGNPASPVTREINRAWYFQPGAILTGNLVVIDYTPGDSWEATVQPIDSDRRVTGPAMTHSTPPRFDQVVATLPADTIRQSTPAPPPVGQVTQIFSTQPLPGAADISMETPNRRTAASALLMFARQRLRRNLRRGLPRVGQFLGRLAAADATGDQRREHFLSAMRAGATRMGATFSSRTSGSGSSFSVTFGNGQTATGSIAVGSRGSVVAHATTTGFRAGSSVGGLFYDLYYGAIISARATASNDGLYEANNARMPINRLRAMLKWGAVTNDFENAARAVGISNSFTPQENYSALINAVSQRVDRVYPNARLADDDSKIIYDGGEITLTELRNAATRPANDITIGASPDAVLVVGLLRRLEAATSASARTALSTTALGNSDFERLFSMGEDAAFASDGEAAAPEVEPVDNHVRPERRTTTGGLINDIRRGVPASPSTPTRGVIQAAQARNMRGVRQGLNALAEKINEELHDATIRMKRWLQTLPEGDTLSATLIQSVIGSMYTARKKRDDVLRRMYDEHVAAVDRAVIAFADKYKVSTETAAREIGYTATARTIPARNAWLLRKRTRALAALRRQLQEAIDAQQTETTEGMVPAAQAAAANAPVQTTAVEALQQQIAQAQAQLVELVAAINNSSLSVRKHGGGGVAGMNNAQAKAILDGIRARYGAAGLADANAVAEQIYTMNAAKLVLDIESGKTNPAEAAEFLERPAALGPMQELRDMAASVDAANEASVAALEAKRKEVARLVRTEYVPLSGDPTKDIDDASFHGGSGIPNVQRDYALEGRERGAPPDDGLSTSRAALMKSASYYGWRDFQDGIAAIHRAMTPEQRDAYGLHAQRLEPGRSTLSNKAVVRHRNGRTTAYVFNDESLVDAIRGASRLENNLLLEAAGKVTKVYSYLATQANPFFAPFNFIRDSWERSEFIRTRTYLRADGTEASASAISNAMLKYLADADLMRATARYAFGRPLDTSSRTGRYLDEFLRQGGVSVFSSQFGADRTKMIAQINKQKSWKQQVGVLGRWIEGYNKTFDVGPALAAYMAMRDAGLATKDAAAGALDLMDFGKRGKSASIFSSIYAFAQPTFTGAANAITALRDPKTGRWNRVGVTRLMGYTAGFLMLQALLRSLADDDEGGNKLDQQSGFTKNNFLLIPYGEDGMIKVPLAYGLTRVANGIARAALGVGTNEQTPAEAAGSLVSGSVVPVFSPIEDSDIDWFERPAQALLTLFAPSWLKPPLALATNTTPFDAQIINSKYADPTKFKSEQFGKYSPESYKDMARALRQATGIDMAPEEIRYIFRTYPTGVLQLGINGPLEDKSVSDATLKKVYANYSEFARYFQFKKALDETDELLKRSNAGESITDEMDRKKLMWRLQWNETDKELRAAKGRATRAANKGLLKTDAIDGMFGDQRMAAQVRALYNYRLMQGKNAAVGEPVEPD